MTTTAGSPDNSEAKMSSSALDDVVMQRIGPWGKWQLRVFLLLAAMGILAAWQVLSANFMAPEVDHWCARPTNSVYTNWTVDQWKEFAIPPRNRTAADAGSNETKVFGQCEMYDISTGHPTRDRIVSCTTFEYDRSIFPDTITSEWDLVCARSALRRVLGGVYMVGYLVGVVGYGILSDKIGRRNAMLAICVQSIFFSIGTTFCRNFYAFLVFRFFTAVALAGGAAVSFVLIMELVGGVHRATVGIGVSMSFSVGLLLLPALAYVIKPWRYLQFATSIPSVFTIIYFCYLPETPRWLLTQGRIEDAEKYFKAAEKVNKKHNIGSASEIELKESVSDLEVPNTGAPKEDKVEIKAKNKATILDLFKTPNMRKMTLNLYFNWFVNAFVYYGLTLNIGDLGGDVYVNTVISGVAELAASFAAMFAIIRIGRRLSLSVSLLAGGVACLLTVAVPSGHFPSNWPVVVLASIGKFGISGSFAIIYVISAEIYPTVVRNSGVGSSSMFARFGSILAPFVPLLDEAAGGFRVSMLLYGATSILAGFLTLLLPETNGKKLPETMEDGENFK